MIRYPRVAEHDVDTLMLEIRPDANREIEFNFDLIDDAGSAVYAANQTAAVDRLFGEVLCWRKAVRAALPHGRSVQVAEDTDTRSLPYTVRRDGDRNLRFEGRVVAVVASTPNPSSSLYSGKRWCWTELALYQTVGGRYVCETVHRCSWLAHERTRYGATVCDKVDGVFAAFGTGWLAKMLYEQAGLTFVEMVA